MKNGFRASAVDLKSSPVELLAAAYKLRNDRRDWHAHGLGNPNERERRKVMKNEDRVRSATRVLSVLEAVSEVAVANLDHICRATKLPKPTAVRLLHTLISAGYVRKVSRSEGYALAERVLRLSDGFRHSDLVVEVARGYLEAFTATHKWPMTLQTYDRGAMRNRFTTRDRSPLASDPAWINRRFPILTTAHGQVYLAFCADAEREMVLAILKASNAPANALAHESAALSKMIAEVRRKGYALRAATARDRVLGFAVPVLHTNGISATVGMRYFASAMSTSEAVARYLGPLKQVALSISSALGHAEQEPNPSSVSDRQNTRRRRQRAE